MIDLFYADESHVCTDGYVPYGWQFRGEDVHIPSQKIARLNIFGMTTRDNRYVGFTSRGSITAEKLSDFLDRLSLRPRRKNTVIVLDNASIHRSGIMKEMRPVWEGRGHFLFYHPPYTPHHNLAETLRRV
ncbi:MAG: transposase, partial [Paludibacteraceae bacterium]|nr:transposase [Paludibacteraceae bacterium]